MQKFASPIECRKKYYILDSIYIFAYTTGYIFIYRLKINLGLRQLIVSKNYYVRMEKYTYTTHYIFKFVIIA